MSLFVHGAFYFLFYHVSPVQHFDNTQRPIEITMLNSPQSEQQFVTDPDLGQIADKLRDQAKYLSQFNRRVRKEQVAKETGETKNRVPVQANELKSKIVKRSLKTLAPESDFKFKPEKVEARPNDRGFVSNLPSTISEYIPNVQEGDFTVLNTDQFSYYAFFNRINQQIRLRWISNIRRLAIELPTQVINQYASFPRVSRIELILDKEGEFVNAFVDSTSGARELDDAAVNAFIDAAPYLNPPTDLIDKNGFIRLNYSFRVVWKPRYLAKDQGLGN